MSRIFANKIKQAKDNQSELSKIVGDELERAVIIRWRWEVRKAAKNAWSGSSTSKPVGIIARNVSIPDISDSIKLKTIQTTDPKTQHSNK